MLYFQNRLCTFTHLEKLDVSNKDLNLSTIHTHGSTEYTAYNGYSLQSVI